MIQGTTALRKVSALRKKIKVIRGGQGSGKTISILILLINHAARVPDREVLVISAELTKMRLTVIKDFVKTMKIMGIFSEHRFIAGTLYRFPNGSFIKFLGLDKDDVGKGLRSHVAYFNEVNKCDKESYRQVATRAQKVYMDYNPDAQFFVDKDIIPREDCDFLQLTFEDNELLPETERLEIMNYCMMGYGVEYDRNRVNYPDPINDHWANIFSVYGLGNIGSLQGAIYGNWKQCDKMPESWKWKAFGLDWGYSNDPSAAVEVCYFEGAIYMNELLYEKGLTNPQLAERLQGFKSGEWIADSSEPKSIAEVRGHGFRIRGCPKGADSIRSGIDKLRSIPIFVTSSSVNLIKELRGYVWKTDKTGEHMGVPVDNLNHLLDAARYVCMEKLKSSSGKYAIR
jgi:phage terminase large subunit